MGIKFCAYVTEITYSQNTLKNTLQFPVKTELNGPNSIVISAFGSNTFLPKLSCSCC